jgi:GNAT superfamily N-acetyltransferase
VTPPGDLAVRPATSDDLVAVLAIHARRDPGTEPPAAPSARQQEAWAATIGRDGMTVYLGVLDGEPVGTATLLLMPSITQGCEPTAFVEAMVVDHRFRRRGVATAVLRRLLDDADAAGVNKVQLLSHKRHATDGAHALYLGLGFEPLAEGFRRYLRSPPPAR